MSSIENGMVAGAARAWERQNTDTKAAERQDRVAHYQTDGADFLDALLDGSFQFAFRPEHEMRAWADRWTAVPDLRLPELKAQQALDEAAVHALQGIWMAFTTRGPLTEREKVLALWIESNLAPQVAKDVGEDRPGMVSRLCASLLPQTDTARRIGEITGQIVDSLIGRRP